jgi:hypothetical protein
MTATAEGSGASAGISVTAWLGFSSMLNCGCGCACWPGAGAIGAAAALAAAGLAVARGAVSSGTGGFSAGTLAAEVCCCGCGRGFSSCWPAAGLPAGAGAAAGGAASAGNASRAGILAGTTTPAEPRRDRTSAMRGGGLGFLLGDRVCTTAAVGGRVRMGGRVMGGVRMTSAPGAGAGSGEPGEGAWGARLGVDGRNLGLAA